MPPLGGCAAAGFDPPAASAGGSGLTIASRRARQSRWISILDREREYLPTRNAPQTSLQQGRKPAAPAHPARKPGPKRENMKRFQGIKWRAALGEDDSYVYAIAL